MSKCILWTGAKTDKGYGIVVRKGKRYRVHRLVAGAKKGEIVRHTCDVRNCVNPDHLIIGTQKENIYDSIERGTHKLPTPRHKLAPEQVKDVLTKRMSLSAFEALYGLDRTAIWRIQKNGGYLVHNSLYP